MSRELNAALLPLAMEYRHSVKPAISIALQVVVMLQALFCTRACAGLIIDPSAGAELVTNFGDPPNIDFVVQIPLDGTFQGRFFGQSAPSSIYASDNGNLNFVGDDWYVSGTNNDIARISPFWDDFLFSNGLPNRITSQHNPGSFLAVSWVRSHLFLDLTPGEPFPGTDRSFQALWIESDVSIRGFDFKRDDIAFSYVGHVAGTPNFGPEVYARVALDDGTGTSGRTAILPGSDNGQIVAADGALLPWQEDQFLLFRWNSALDNYDVSIQSLTAIPEPSSLVLVLGFAAAGGAGKLGRRLIVTQARGSKAKNVSI